MNYSAPPSQWNTSFSHPIPHTSLSTSHLAPRAIQSIQPNGHSPTLSPSPTTSSSVDSDSPKKTPRPPNAFMLFRSDFVKKMPSYVEARQQNLSKIAGRVWGALDNEYQKPWYEEAQKVVLQHRAKYPGYVYKPSKRASLGVRSISARPRNPLTDHSDIEIASMVKKYIGLTISPQPSSKKPKKNARNAKKVRAAEALERVRTPAPPATVVHEPVPIQNTSTAPMQFVQHVDQTPPSMQFYPGHNFQASPAFLPRRPSTSMGFIETASKAHMSDAFNNQYEVQSEPSSSPSALHTMLASGQGDYDIFNPQREMLAPQQQPFQRAEQGLFYPPGFGDMSYAPVQQPMFYEPCIAPHQLFLQFPQPTMTPMTPMTTGEMSLPQTPPTSNDLVAPSTACDETDLFGSFEMGQWDSQTRAADFAAADAQKMVEDVPLFFDSDAAAFDDQWNIDQNPGVIDPDLSLLLTQFGHSSL